jgi:type VI secretion system protein ImpA
MPLSGAKYDFFAYQESRKIPYESEISGNESKTKARTTALAEGKISPETFDKSFEETKKQFYKDLERDLKAAQDSLQQLDDLCKGKFGSFAPSYVPLRKAVEEVSNAVHILLLKKLEKEPDPVEAAAPSETAEGEGGTETPTVTFALPGGTQLDLSQFEGGEIKSADQALLHTVVAAQFLRQKNPSNPVPYLLLRALRWGEVRASSELKPAELKAPAAEVRMTLRAASQAGNWKQVLDVAEAAMSNTCGRAWLDLQRYAVKACDQLGYAAAAKAVRSELKSYLTDYPDLPKAVLHDDTGTSNPETLEWLKQEGMIS